MDTKLSINRKFNRMFVNILSIVAILAIAFPAVGSAYAQETALPEGWHDGVEGSVNAASCGAFGWAVDPDDSDRDLQVRILADGIPVATTTANLLREDVEACNGGTCGFGVDLWGLISAGEEHQITVQAFDEETQTWFDLSGTPKTLTCWGYPEGFHDGNEGEVDANSCSAFGWSADPDDRDRDVQIRILSDGEEVAATTASDYGEDMEQYGICPGGTCRFTVDLWELVSHDQEHQITVQAYDEESDDWWNLEGTPKSLICLTPPPPNPHFTVFPDWEFFDGLDWPDGTTVAITVASKPECTTSKESWDGFFNGNFGEGCNIEYGDEVTFTDAITTRTHNVRILYVTDVDIADNTVKGKAEVEAGTIVYVWPHDAWFEPLQAIVDESGEWQVNLGNAGYTIRDDSEGRAEIRDEMGNATAEDWHVTHPRFTVFPEWEWFDGNDWSNGTTVYITVAGKPECETAKESWGYFFNGSFGEECDIEIGDTVTFKAGETTRKHTVQNLTVTKANQEDDTIKGTADPGAEVYVWPHATGQEQVAIAKTKGAAKGNWNVDFSGIYDLTLGECGRSEIRDEYANSTAVDWCISNPRIVASESGDWFWTTEFKPGDLDISIYDSPDDNASLLWSGQQVADEGGFTFVGSDIHSLDLVPGNYLVISDGDSQKGLVLQPISVTMFDTEYDFMAGFAPVGSEVWAAAGPQDWQEQIMINADPVTGEWFADFAEIGFDITEEMQPWSYAQIFDDDGDANEADPPPLEFWTAVWTYGPPADFLQNGEHSYYYELTYTMPENFSWSGSESPGVVTVSEETPTYDGYALLGPWDYMPIQVWNGSACEVVSALNPDQPIRYISGWVNDYPMTYEEALAHFNSITLGLSWDGAAVDSASFTMGELLPFTGQDSRIEYICTFTEHR